MNIQNGPPTKIGMYVVYVDAGNSQYPKKELMIWSDGEWSRPGSDQRQRRAIYGWIGPLPSPSTEKLKYRIKKYAIGTEMGREFGSYKAGIFDTMEQALDEIGDDGDFVYEISSDSSVKAVAKWSKKKFDWVFRKRKK
jgi:hypothetical protein